MKILFFGTPDYVLPLVERLHKEFNHGLEKEFIGVVTQPPKPAGRDKKIERSAVDDWGYKHRMEVYFDLDSLPEADLGIVASYGRIIPESVIAKFSKGLINIHPSRLPQFRGASPIQAQIALGTDPFGLTLIKMDELMDHGPILTQVKDNLLPDDTFESVRNRVFSFAADVLIEMLPAYLSGKINLKEQDHDNATFTTLLKKDHGFIDWIYIEHAMDGKIRKEEIPYGFIRDMSYSPTALNIERLIRAMTPWPYVWTIVTLGTEEKRLKILKAHVSDTELVLDEVQLEGKDPVTWKQFKEGYPNIVI